MSSELERAGEQTGAGFAFKSAEASARRTHCSSLLVYGFIPVTALQFSPDVGIGLSRLNPTTYFQGKISVKAYHTRHRKDPGRLSVGMGEVLMT